MSPELQRFLNEHQIANVNDLFDYAQLVFEGTIKDSDFSDCELGLNLHPLKSDELVDRFKANFESQDDEHLSNAKNEYIKYQFGE